MAGLCRLKKGKQEPGMENLIVVLPTTAKPVSHSTLFAKAPGPP